MATIGTDDGGHRRILFVAADGKRKTIRLSKCSTKQAEYHKVRIEDLISSQGNGVMQAETRDWLATLPQKIHDRLYAVGLVKKRQDAGANTLGPFLDSYIAGRSDVKLNTLIGMKQARRNLVAFFGEKKPLSEITAGDAEEYWRYLVGTQKLATNTARRLCGRAKQFFKFAGRKGFVRGNPFADIKTNVGSNTARLHFVTRETAQEVIDACPDSEWKLIFALCRYGGFRCPSEHMALTWGDVDWHKGRIRVPSPKTEHIEGHESRVIPLFPELRPLLQDVYDAAEEGAVNVIARHRGTNINLRTQLNRILSRAGVKPWPKLFHNLRATRETELADEYPLHVVCEWIGNTPEVAKRHYLQMRDEHFAKAIGVDEKPAQNPAQSGKPAHKAAHHTATPGTTEPQLTPVGASESQVLCPGESVCVPVGGNQWPLSESNNPPDSPGKSHFTAESGTNSGTLVSRPGRYTFTRGRVRQRVPRTVRTAGSEQTRRRVVELLSR